MDVLGERVTGCLAERPGGGAAAVVPECERWVEVQRLNPTLSAEGVVGDHAYSPIDFHDPSQIAGTPFFDDDRFIIKFNNFWTIQAPAGYSLLFTHPVNRRDLPFTTLTGLVDCDAFYNNPVLFPARWHDVDFNGVLPKGTPVAQCLPVKRENWGGRFETLSDDDASRLFQSRAEILQGNDVYRHKYRAGKR